MKFKNQVSQALVLCTSAPLRDGHFPQVGEPAHRSVLLCVRQIHIVIQQRPFLDAVPRGKTLSAHCIAISSP